MNKQRKYFIIKRLETYGDEYIWPLCKSLKIDKVKFEFSSRCEENALNTLSHSNVIYSTNALGIVNGYITLDSKHGQIIVKIYIHKILEKLESRKHFKNVTNNMIFAACLYQMAYETFKVYIIEHEFYNVVGKPLTEVEFNPDVEKRAHKFANEFIRKWANTDIPKDIGTYMYVDFFNQYFQFTPEQVKFFNKMQEDAIRNIEKYVETNKD